jgi:hypothetical protein
MPAKKYIVDLTAEERTTLVGVIRHGKAAARQVTRARILLKADEGLTDKEIAEEVVTSKATVEVMFQFGIWPFLYRTAEFHAAHI